jgi:hypothetical protein
LRPETGVMAFVDITGYHLPEVEIDIKENKKVSQVIKSID